ncbi:hypothetical protein [Salana multivorans]
MKSGTTAHRTIERHGGVEPIVSRADLDVLQRRAQSAQSALLVVERTIRTEAARLEQVVQHDMRRLSCTQLRDLHRRSADTADEWHRQKQDAIAIRRQLSRALDRLREQRRQCAQQRDSTHGDARRRFASQANELGRLIGTYYATLETLNAEIRRADTMLTQYNIQTGRIRDYLAVECPPPRGLPPGRRQR